MQDRTASPRQYYTAAEVNAVLAFSAGGLVRWGVDVLDAAGNPKTAVEYLYDTNSEWQSGTHYGTTTVGNTLTRV